MASINASTSGAGGVITTADNTGILNLQTASTTAVTVDASQNVGIGTTAPRSLLDVVSGTANTAGDSVGALTVTGAAPNYGVAGYGTLTVQSNDAMAIDKGGGIAFGARTTTASTAGVQVAGITGAKENGTSGNTAGYLGFYTRTAGAGISERMRIDSSGRVMVNGTDAASTWHYTGKFHVKSDAGSGSTVMSVRYAGTSAFPNISIENDNGRVGYIQTSGTSTTYSTSSDYRLKDNVLPMAGALDTVMQLNPVTFTWKNDGSNGQGFIAHELQAVVPDCVGGQKDGMREDGTPDYQGVDTSFLVATLTAAIQEMKAIIDEQSTRITALENA